MKSFNLKAIIISAEKLYQDIKEQQETFAYNGAVALGEMVGYTYMSDYKKLFLKHLSEHQYSGEETTQTKDMIDLLLNIDTSTLETIIKTLDMPTEHKNKDLFLAGQNFSALLNVLKLCGKIAANPTDVKLLDALEEMQQTEAILKTNLKASVHAFFTETRQLLNLVEADRKSITKDLSDKAGFVAHAEKAMLEMDCENRKLKVKDVDMQGRYNVMASELKRKEDEAKDLRYQLKKTRDELDRLKLKQHKPYDPRFMAKQPQAMTKEEVRSLNKTYKH